MGDEDPDRALHGDDPDLALLRALEALPQQPLTPAQRMRRLRRKWGPEGRKGFDSGDRSAGQEPFIYLYNRLTGQYGQAATDLMINHRVHPFLLNKALLLTAEDLELWFEATGERVDRLEEAQRQGLEVWLWETHDRARAPNRYVPERPQNERPDEEMSCRQGKGRPANARQFLSQQVEREESRVVRVRVRVAHDSDDSADSNIGDTLAWLWRFQDQNTRALRSTRLGRIRLLVLKGGRKRQCLTAWPASDARSLPPVGYIVPGPKLPPLRITGLESALWRQDGFHFPSLSGGITVTEWRERRGKDLPRAGAKYIPLAQITKHATRRGDAADRKRGVFYGYHYLAGHERRWAARAPAETHGQHATRRPYRRDVPIARDHNTKPVPTDKSRKPTASAGCEFRWLEGWGWGLFDQRPPTALTWRPDGDDIAARVIECKRRREAAIDGLLSNFGGSTDE